VPSDRSAHELPRRLVESINGTTLEYVHIALQRHANTDDRWSIHPLMEHMKAKAKAQGLWNLWISPDLAAHIQPVLSESSTLPPRLLLGCGLSNLVLPPAFHQPRHPSKCTQTAQFLLAVVQRSICTLTARSGINGRQRGVSEEMRRLHGCDLHCEQIFKGAHTREAHA
jgi:hypothetical protein